jgi:hypothetical protein
VAVRYWCSSYYFSDWSLVRVGVKDLEWVFGFSQHPLYPNNRKGFFMGEAKRGDRVSLNTVKRSYYFQGNGGINLRHPEEEMAIIPETATDQHLQQINHALKQDQLILGWPETRAEVPSKDSEINTILEGGRNKINAWIDILALDKTLKSSVKTETIEKLIVLERAGKNRISVIKWAENALSSIGGVSLIEETDHQKIEIKLTSGSDEPAENK